MCGCELHYRGPGPCVCRCPEHEGHRREDAARHRRESLVSELAAARAEVARLEAEVYRLNDVLAARLGGAR